MDGGCCIDYDMDRKGQENKPFFIFNQEDDNDVVCCIHGLVPHLITRRVFRFFAFHEIFDLK